MASINPDKALPDRHVEELKDGQKVAFCRCWQSKKFPYCDGSHRKHNEETGDKVGPVVVTCCKKEATANM